MEKPKAHHYGARVTRSNMDLQIRALAAARRKEKEIGEMRAAAREALDATEAGRHLAACECWIQETKEEVARLEAGVREEALAVFEGLGDANPHPAVKVKRFTVYDYDPAAALEYARLHLPSTVRLDAPKFKKACSVIEVPGVTARIEPRATIKRDLSQWDDSDG